MRVGQASRLRQKISGYGWIRMVIRLVTEQAAIGLEGQAERERAFTTGLMVLSESGRPVSLPPSGLKALCSGRDR